jgi:hypothetical protein
MSKLQHDSFRPPTCLLFSPLIQHYLVNNMPQQLQQLMKRVHDSKLPGIALVYNQLLVYACSSKQHARADSVRESLER